MGSRNQNPVLALIDEVVANTEETPQVEREEAAELDQAVLVLNVHRLDMAQALPEVAPDIETDQVTYAAGSIEAFKDENRRTMRVVHVGGVVSKQPFSN